MSQPAINLHTSKDTVKPYYVYAHRRATDGGVFYVGKGKGDRAWNTYGRSDWWKRITKKHGREVDILMRFDREKCAFSFERALISYYGRENLCNLTDGGEGASGLVHSADTLSKMSGNQSGYRNPRYDPTTYLFFHRKHGIFTCSKYEFRMMTGIAKENVRALVKGRIWHISGWGCSGETAV